MEKPNMTIQTYQASCTCGKNRFEADIDLTQGTFKCNCESCTKTRFWGVLLQPSNFRLLSKESELSIYKSEAGNQHFFCKYCGVKVFNKGKFIAINLAALDDLSPEEWVKAPIKYFDGRHDKFDRAPDFTTHL
jgi:hypothetical protein